jgi:tRNA 2-thiouridine synthesizing protein B
VLHIVNRAPGNPALADCLRFCSDDAGILLIEDGVYAAVANGPWLQRLLQRTRNVYVLEADACARGLSGRIGEGIERVDYARFVALCCEYPRMHSWY